MSRLRELSAEQQRAGAAAAALFLTLFLPWYSHPIPSPRGGTASDRVNAWQAFSFVEAAVLLVAASIVWLLWARSERRAFHLPGGDGWAVTVGGAWVGFLLVWRLFDKPDFTPGPVGIEWGLFVAILVAGVVVAMGQRMRAEHRPEPPNPAAEDIDWTSPSERARRRRDRAPVDAHAVTRTLRDDRPSWEGEPPEAPTTRLPGDRGDSPTRRIPGDPGDSPTRRIPGDAGDSPTRRITGDAGESPTRRLGDSPTRRYGE